MATLEGKTVLVIGGSSGIGFGVAKCSLLAQASRVIIASKNPERLEDALVRLKTFFAEKPVPGTFSASVVDAKDSSSVKALLESVGEIDHLVWTSGDPLRLGPLEKLDFDANRDLFDVRFWGAVVAAQSAKIRPGGSITLTVGSVVVKPKGGWTLGAALMGAVDSVTRALAVDLAPIRVNVISPGLVETELWNPMPKEQVKQMMEASAKSLLVKHVATPEEIAEAYLFTMKCGYITGQRIEVDGGYKYL